MRNDTNQSASDVKIIATPYKADGNVAFVGDGFAKPNTLTPGTVSPFDVLGCYGVPYVQTVLLAQGSASSPTSSSSCAAYKQRARSQRPLLL